MGSDEREQWGFMGLCRNCGKRFVSRGEDPFIAETELLIKIARHEAAVLRWKQRSVQREINRNAERILVSNLPR